MAKPPAVHDVPDTDAEKDSGEEVDDKPVAKRSKAGTAKGSGEVPPA